MKTKKKVWMETVERDTGRGPADIWLVFDVYGKAKLLVDTEYQLCLL